MEISFKEELEKEIEKLCEGLNKFGMKVEMPPLFYVDEREIFSIGKFLPRMQRTVIGEIRFEIPEHLLKVKLEP